MKKFFKEIKKYPLVIFFAVLFYTISVADLFSPVEKTSELENRELATWPKFSFESLFNNEYTPKIERFTEDHFIFRDTWISIKSMCESVLGKTENNGIVYGKDGYMFTKFLGTDYTQLKENFESIKEFTERHSERNIHLLIAPTAPSIKTDEVRNGSPVVDYNYIYSQAKEIIGGKYLMDVVPSLSRHKDEYIYYRTDHHWTTLGAYYAYREFMEKVGNTPVSYENLKKTEVNDFYGTHYSKAKTYNAVPDVLTYIETDCQMEINGKTMGLYDLEALDKRDKYAAFLHGNPGQATVYGKGEGKILVIKDSYANCFIPFLTENYEQIDLIDPRYVMMGLDAMIREQDYGEILFLYNRENLITDEDLRKINFFNK